MSDIYDIKGFLLILPNIRPVTWVVVGGIIVVMILWKIFERIRTRYEQKKVLAAHISGDIHTEQGRTIIERIDALDPESENYLSELSILLRSGVEEIGYVSGAIHKTREEIFEETRFDPLSEFLHAIEPYEYGGVAIAREQKIEFRERAKRIILHLHPRASIHTESLHDH